MKMQIYSCRFGRKGNNTEHISAAKLWSSRTLFLVMQQQQNIMTYLSRCGHDDPFAHVCFHFFNEEYLSYRDKLYLTDIIEG